jgi:hypothetical protein
MYHSIELQYLFYNFFLISAKKIYKFCSLRHCSFCVIAGHCVVVVAQWGHFIVFLCKAQDLLFQN